MKKGTEAKISEYVQPNGLCTIYMERIGLNLETLVKCIDLTKRFTTGDKFFFGHYRRDGTNLSDKEQTQYSIKIPQYYKTNGRYEPLTVSIRKKNNIRNYSGFLTAGYLPVNEETYEMLPKIFHYFLETIYFSPKVDWITFVESYRNYINHGANDYVLNGFTDFLFAYGDSGDFSISFNDNLYDKNIIYQVVKNIISN